jgi:hypothetical protein
MNAPSAAVAVQPYQYIAGARNPIEGSTTSRAWCVPRRTTPIEGYGEQRKIQFERDHVENREGCPIPNAKLQNACEDVMTQESL